MRKSALALIVIIIILAAVAAFYYSSLASAGRFSNGNISFEYPNSFALSQSPVNAENSTGNFICAISSPSHNSTIIIYQIPLNTTRNISSNQTQNTTTNNTTSSQSNNTTNTTVTNRTILVTADNLQAYLDGVIFRGGTTQNVSKNNYTLYVSTNLKSALVSYNSSSRTGNATIISINETAIVKNGFVNFYVIELINGDNSQDASNAYNQIVNSFRIGVS